MINKPFKICVGVIALGDGRVSHSYPTLKIWLFDPQSEITPHAYETDKTLGLVLLKAARALR